MKHNSLPYIRKLDEHQEIEIWEVDGSWIRKNIDIEFTNMAQPFDKKYIPKTEFWIDRESSPDERAFFQLHLQVEHSMQKAGVPLDSAHKLALVAEDHLRDAFKGRSAPYIRQLKTIKEIIIYLVDGKVVRDWYDTDFTEGGHDLVYKWIPKGEIWIDNDLTPFEREFVILHESTERNLMEKGMPYEKAHKMSSAKELKKRKESK